MLESDSILLCALLSEKLYCENTQKVMKLVENGHGLDQGSFASRKSWSHSLYSLLRWHGETKASENRDIAAVTAKSRGTACPADANPLQYADFDVPNLVWWSM